VTTTRGRSWKLICVLSLALFVPYRVPAQTYQVLYNFTDSPVGGFPNAGLTTDRAGRLYGTAFQGGNGTAGGVFRLVRSGPSWRFEPLYAFTGGSDGAYPTARVIFGPDGTLYGTTEAGGGTGCFGEGCGVVFNLKPPPNACAAALCYWKETIIYRFVGGNNDGAYPRSEVVFDSAGNLYGTTSNGGPSDLGTVYQLSPTSGGWTERVLYAFGGNSGGTPLSGLILDAAGALYGTTQYSFGFNYGTVFKLTRSGSNWSESDLYSFTDGSDGGMPTGGLIFDGSGNLYGTTPFAGVGSGGTAFELVPSNGSWTFNLLQSFPGDGQHATGPNASMTFGATGNLYGTTTGTSSGPDYGTVFELTPTSGGWTQTVLHAFAGSDGELPFSNVIFDSSGNLYGTASQGGGYGVVWEITP
jgi:uncharacterized repeat protein (TIGR03803 family)